MADSTAVVYGLPHALHEWAPEQHAGTASSTVGLACSTAVGSVVRSGTTTTTLPLAGSGTGAATRRGTLSLALPLTRTAAGVQLTAIRAGSALGVSVGLARIASGMASRSGAATQAQILVSLTASGQSYRASSSYSSLPLSAAGAGAKTAVGSAPTQLGLGFVHTGLRLEYVFLSPTTDDYVRLVPRSDRFVATTPYGQTVWRDALGVWHTKFSPNPDRLIGADRIFPGGRQAPLTDASRAELIAAGFASNITLKEYR